MLVTEPARDGGKIVTGREGVARFEIFVKGVPAHAGTRPEDGRSAIRELAHVIQTLDAMNDLKRGVTVNVGVVSGGTKPNVIAEEAYAEVDMRVPTIADADELVPKILNLKSRTEGVSVRVTGELNRPPYEKGNAGAALYEHARDARRRNRLRAGRYLDRRRLRRQFHRAAYRNARRPRRRRQGRAYPLRADVHLVDRAEGAAVASAVPDAAMSAADSDPGNAMRRRRCSPSPARLVLRPPQGPQAARASGRSDRALAAAAFARYRRRQPADLTGLFDPPVDDVRLEIGFGGGEHLIAEARAFPNTGFIGCEPYVNGMAKILAQIEAHNIGNIRLFAGDAAELLAWAPPRSLARIDLIHPDPWPKRRHWKRRFVQDATVAAMARVLKPGGEFRFVSDIDDYCAWTLAHLSRSPRFRLDRGARLRLAPAVARLHDDALRRQGRARRTQGGLFAVSEGWLKR